MERRARGSSRTGGEGAGSRIPVPAPFYTPTPQRKNHHHSSNLNKHSSLQSLNHIGLHRHERRGGPDHDDDTDSVRSFASGYSGCSTASAAHRLCTGPHVPFGKNGTTYSGRNKKYVVHCSSNHGSPEQYLTPTQRANSTIRHLKTLLTDSRVELEEKEREIARLTKELVQLRLGKAEERRGDGEDEGVDSAREEDERSVKKRSSSQHSSPQQTPVRTPILTNGHPIPSSPDHTYTDGPPSITLPRGGGSPLAVSTSLSDSGHFEELSPHPSPRVSSALIEKELDKLKHQHEEEVKALKDSSNAQVDTLVQRLAEANDRYFDISSRLEEMQSKIEELEKEKEAILAKCQESEERHKKTYLHMFNKGQQAAIFQQAGEENKAGEPIITVPELLKQLEVTKKELDSVKTMYRRLLENKKSKTEQDAEVTLQFLKSAIYYFLTDKENTAGHLAAIQSILGFSQDERHAIDRASYYSWK